jgi:hypothetical protein
MTALDPRTHARTTDPDTSHEAAAKLTPRSTMMARLLSAFLDCDRNADEATEAAGYSPADGAWKRISDLAAVGWIADTGERREGRSGRRQIVWYITDDGMRAAAALLRHTTS